jgi:hypothetical protein
MSHISEISKRNKAFDKKYENERYCRGCGTTNFLSRAHIIRISLRKDLELELDNMAYLCLSINGVKGCHQIWDDGSIYAKKSLKCFDEFMKYIKEKDELLYNRLNS